MSDEPVPSRSYVVKQGGFTDPIVDAVMNLGRTVSKDGDAGAGMSIQGAYDRVTARTDRSTASLPLHEPDARSVNKKRTRKAQAAEPVQSTKSNPHVAPLTTASQQIPHPTYTPPLLPNRSQHSLASSARTPMPGSFPTSGPAPVPTPAPPLGSGTLRSVPNPFTTTMPQKGTGMYLAKAPEMPHRGSSRSGGLGTGGGNMVNPVSDIPVLDPSPVSPMTTTTTALPGISLVLPSSFPKPPPIQMPPMQQPPKFAPIPEPLWERGNVGKSDAERFKEMVLLGTSPGTNGNGNVNGNMGPGDEAATDRPKRKKKKRRREVINVPTEDVPLDGPAESELTARPLDTRDQAVRAPQTVEEDEALLEQQRQDTRRRRRRTMRSAIVAEEGGQGAVGSRGLTRGASMRRRNVWDDVPEFANLDSPTIPEADETEGNQEQDHDANQQALHEPPPPPFPYPTPSTGRLPPAFGSVVIEGHEGRRSPPPSFEVATRGDVPKLSEQHADVQTELDDAEEEVPPSPSTVSTVRRARIRDETPRQRRRREDRERWERAREEGKDLDELVSREKERIERMQHWGQTGSAAPSILEQGPAAAGSIVAPDEDDPRFSREQKGKGRAVYYDATDLAADEPIPGPGLSRASSMSTNLARSVREPMDEEDDLPVLSTTRGNSQEVEMDQNGEGSKPSGFVTQELALAGIDLGKIVGIDDEEQDQRTEVPALTVDVGETVRSHSPSTPKAPQHALSPDSTVIAHVQKEDKEELPTSPNMHGSRFLEGISEGPDGQPEVVPGVLDRPVTREEPETISPPPAVPEKDAVVVPGEQAPQSPAIARKNSLPPLFSKRRSGRKISNPWTLFRQTSSSNKKAEVDKATEPSPSPGVETEEASSPKETGLSKSPFFRAAGQFLKPNLGLEPKKEEEKKEEVDHVRQKSAPAVVAPVIMPSWNRQVSASTVKTTSASTQPMVAYKHPFNRAVKPAWMQNAAPIWQDPKAYVMDESRPLESPAEEQPMSPLKAKSPIEKLEDQWEMVPESPQKVDQSTTLPQTTPSHEPMTQRKPATGIPARRPTAIAYPPPLLASGNTPQPASPSSGSSEDESETTEDSESETSSDGWSVSDAVARPPAAYRLLPPRGIPANVLRAANEPPPLPRRNRENRPKPNGPRQRTAPPPLPPRVRPVATGSPSIPAAALVAPKPAQTEALKASEPALSAQPVTAAEAKVEPVPVVQTIAIAASMPRRKSAGRTETPVNNSQPTTPGIPSSTRPTAGDRTPSAISGYFNKPVTKDGDRPRTRSAGAGLRPLTIANNIDASRQEAALRPPSATQGVPVVFPQSKPLRVSGGLPAPTRPKATHHVTSPAERKPKANARLAIKPRYDDRPEQELKSQLSNRINKWRLAAIRPDPPETWEPEDDDEAEVIDQQPSSTTLARSKSMPNFVKVEDGDDEVAASRPVERETVRPQLIPSPPQEDKPDNPPARVEESRQRVTSNRTNRSSKPQTSETRPTSKQGNGQVGQADPSTATPPVRSPGLEYTDLDLVAAQLQGTDREYEGMNAITSFVGEEIARGASPDSLSNLMLAPVEVESRRTTKEGKTKLKLTALGIRVHKCSICLSQFRAGDIMAMMPKCNHLGHQRCVVNWLSKDARCMVCREPL